MDVQRAQLRHQIEQTHAAMGTKLDLLDQRILQTVTAPMSGPQ